MAVSDFFLGSIREFAYSNWPVSMACACTCVDATAKQDIGGGVRKNGEVGLQIKAFIDKYLDIISVVGTGGALRATSGSKICLPNPKSVGQHSPLQDIIYDPIRNHLLHSGELATNMIFTEQAQLGGTGPFHLSTQMIVALLLAVTASPASANITISGDWQIVLNSRPIPFNNLMGDASSVRTWLGIVP